MRLYQSSSYTLVVCSWLPFLIIGYTTVEAAPLPQPPLIAVRAINAPSIGSDVGPREVDIRHLPSELLYGRKVLPTKDRYTPVLVIPPAFAAKPSSKKPTNVKSTEADTPSNANIPTILKLPGPTQSSHPSDAERLSPAPTTWSLPPQFTDLSTFGITKFAYGRQNLKLDTQPSNNDRQKSLSTSAEVDSSPHDELHTTLQLRYPAGSINPGNSIHEQGGADFYASPIDLTKSNNVTLEYSVFFPLNFSFVQGGKLPGLYGGRPGCSGGDAALDCFSTRLMWRSGGAGELYLYAPKTKQSAQVCSTPPLSVCDSEYGLSIGRGSFTFSPGAWTTVKQTVALNTPGEQDGFFTLDVNGVRVLDVQGVYYREGPNSGNNQIVSSQRVAGPPRIPPKIRRDSIGDQITPDDIVLGGGIVKSTSPRAAVQQVAPLSISDSVPLTLSELREAYSTNKEDSMKLDPPRCAEGSVKSLDDLMGGAIPSERLDKNSCRDTEQSGLPMPISGPDRKAASNGFSDERLVYVVPPSQERFSSIRTRLETPALLVSIPPKKIKLPSQHPIGGSRVKSGVTGSNGILTLASEDEDEGGNDESDGGDDHDGAVGFVGIFFSTFFGGHEEKFATPTDQYTWFKDFALRANS